MFVRSIALSVGWLAAFIIWVSELNMLLYSPQGIQDRQTKHITLISTNLCIVQ